MQDIKAKIENDIQELNNAKQMVRLFERSEFKARKKLENTGIDTGRMVVESKNNNYSYYLVKPDGERIYLKKKEDMRTIQCIAQKEYNRKLLKTIDDYLKSLEKMDKLCPEDEIIGVYESLHPARKDVVSPILVPDEDYVKEWLEKEYPTNDYDLPPQTKDTITKNGEIVRSKSEVILADMFYSSGVPYRYEPELILNSGRRVFPDFICLNKRTRREYVWEHFGMMDEMDYICRNLPKMREYEQSGYLLGVNMIVSYESSVVGFSTKVVQSYIDKFLL